MGNMADDLILFQTVQKNVLRWLSLVDSKENADALRRLVNRAEARISWRKLANMTPNDKGRGFYLIASSIGRCTVSAFLPQSKKREKTQIKSAAFKAVSLANKLIKLIHENDTLQTSAECLQPDYERAAFDRLIGGILLISIKNKNEDDRWFDEETEAELDVRQQKRYRPELHVMTTSDAYKIIQYHRPELSLLLMKFAEIASQSATIEPITPRPNKAMADQHVLSLKLCSVINHNYGSPCIDVVTGFLSAVYDMTIDEETVKKWWQRKGDSSA